MWHHWDSKLKRYKPVRLCNGGGLRRKLYSRLTALDIVLDDMVQVYFPGGRNTLCSLNLVTTNFAGADMAVIDKEMTVDRYLEIKALRIPKFILQTRTQSIFNICHSSSSSSESDFEINRDFTRMRKNKKSHSHSTPRSDNDMVTKNNESDVMSFLMTRQDHRKDLVPNEPDLTEDCTLIVVKHVSLGTMQRFFRSDEKIEAVYHWIDSLAAEPELFTLKFNQQDVVVQPEEFVSIAENQILKMNSTYVSDLTMDILDMRRMRPLLNSSKFSVLKVNHLCPS